MAGADLFVRLFLIVIPCLIVMYLLGVLRQIRKPDQLSVWASVKQFYDERKEVISDYYGKESEIDKMFEDAGIYIAPSKFRIVRDTLIIVFLAMIHVHYFNNLDTMPYPVENVFLLIVLYVATLLIPRKPFPAVYILGFLKKGFDKKKNKEIFLLQQLVLNEYSGRGENQTQQRVYHLFKYLTRFMNHIRPAMIHFVSQYNEDAHDPKKPFNTFAEMVGTEEAKNLAEILYSVDMSSGEDVQDLLKAQYEELKTNRQENYRATMQDRGHIGYIITFTGVVMVIGLGMIMYYLEYQDQMKFLVGNG